MLRVIRVEKKFCHWLIDNGKYCLTDKTAIYNLIFEGVLHSELPIIRSDRKWHQYRLHFSWMWCSNRKQK